MAQGKNPFVVAALLGQQSALSRDLSGRVPLPPLSPSQLGAWKPATLLPFEENSVSGQRRPAMPGALSSLIDALMTPGNALRGSYPVQVTDGRVDPYSSLIPPAMNMAATAAPAAPSMRPLGLGGIAPPQLPFSNSLSLPPLPTAGQMARFGKVQPVPLESARATNALDWKRFSKGDHPPELVPGYKDKPVAVRKEDGEYIIFDGNHRTAQAKVGGKKTMDMYVIDAKDYAPASAGRKPAAPSMSDDEILKALFGE